MTPVIWNQNHIVYKNLPSTLDILIKESQSSSSESEEQSDNEINLDAGKKKYNKDKVHELPVIYARAMKKTSKKTGVCV